VSVISSLALIPACDRIGPSSVRRETSAAGMLAIGTCTFGGIDVYVLM
jgi:hypothetical protein